MLDRDLLSPIIHNTAPITGGSGAALYTEDGQVLLDFAQLSVILGQNNPHFIEVMTQALHGATAGYPGENGWKARLYRRLEETTNGAFVSYHLTASGSESTEWAVRLARKLTGKSEVLSFWNSIHGRTYLSSSMSGLPKRKTGYGPLAPGLVFGVYPDCAACPFERNSADCRFFCLRFLEEKLKYESAQDLAAVIVEPCQGATAAAPPAGWLRALQAWTKDRGALLILDEIQTGMGRTGDLYAWQRDGLQPDFVLLGKALGNGMHISALLSAHPLEEEMLPALSGGTGDDALCCAAACAVFDELLDHGLLAHVKEMSRHLFDGLHSMGGDIVSVHGAGLLAGIDYASAEACGSAAARLRRAGCLAVRSAPSRLCFKPPYCITEKQIDVLLNALADL